MRRAVFQVSELPGRLMHDFLVDLLLPLRETDEEGTIAELIDQPGYPIRRPADLVQRRVVEEPRNITATRDLEPELDVLLDRGVRKPGQVEDAGDPLPKLAKPVAIELVLEFGLTDEHDLEQLGVRRPEVGGAAVELSRLFSERFRASSMMRTAFSLGFAASGSGTPGA
ncbi:MAG: hypothetical protein R3E97_10360 [Candidatus Eisenbacteria bacterium]